MGRFNCWSWQTSMPYWFPVVLAKVAPFVFLFYAKTVTIV